MKITQRVSINGDMKADRRRGGLQTVTFRRAKGNLLHDERHPLAPQEDAFRKTGREALGLGRPRLSARAL